MVRTLIGQHIRPAGGKLLATIESFQQPLRHLDRTRNRVSPANSSRERGPTRIWWKKSSEPAGSCSLLSLDETGRVRQGSPREELGSALISRRRQLGLFGLSQLASLHLGRLGFHLGALCGVLSNLGLCRLHGLRHLSARRLKCLGLHELGTQTLDRHELQHHHVSPPSSS